MRSIRWIIPAIAAIALVAALIATRPVFARTPSVRRFSAGVLTVDGQSTLGVLVANHTSYRLHATIRLVNTSGFSATGPVRFSIPPGSFAAQGFGCTNVGSCFGEPIVITSAGVLPSATYTMYTTGTAPDEINISPGEWRTF